MSKTLGIIGSGPAAHTAAIYASRAGINTILFQGDYNPEWTTGGQLMTTTEVENFPGFPDGILGPDLCFALEKQCKRFGTDIRPETVVAVNTCPLEAGGFRVISNRGQEQIVNAVIVATGATAKTLDIPGKNELWNKGISACAVCDGALPQFRNKVLVVIGGGDTAMEEAMFLSRYASEVVIVHRRDSLRASKIMQERIFGNPKVRILWNTQIVRANGNDRLESVALNQQQEDGSTLAQVLECAGLFFAIGHQPNSDFLGDLIERDSDGYILAQRNHTSRAGIFAAGDVQDKIYRQAITAAGSGCSAALEAIHYLDEN